MRTPAVERRLTKEKQDVVLTGLGCLAGAYLNTGISTSTRTASMSSFFSRGTTGASALLIEKLKDLSTANANTKRSPERSWERSMRWSGCKNEDGPSAKGRKGHDSSVRWL